MSFISAIMCVLFVHIFRPEKISGALKTRWKNVGNSFLDLLHHWTLTKPELPCDFFSKAIPMSELVHYFIHCLANWDNACYNHTIFYFKRQIWYIYTAFMIICFFKIRYHAIIERHYLEWNVMYKCNVCTCIFQLKEF